MTKRSSALSALLLASCSGASGAADSGPLDGGPIVRADAASMDASPAPDASQPLADAGPPDAGWIDPGPEGPEVRVIYLVPSDRTTDETYVRVAGRAIRHIQRFYLDQMGDGRTFRTHDPLVEVFPTTHPSDWYSTHDDGSPMQGWWWDNTVADGFALTGGAFNDPQYVYVFYNDSDPLCGQTQGAGTSHVCAMPANDLRGLAHAWPLVHICPTDPDFYYTFPECRWVGGLGHELGHAFGLPHPPGCEAGAASCDSNALLWSGVYSYPDTYLRDDDRAFLGSIPFFAARGAEPLFDCNAL